jgi:phosphohistidine phosphatase SixA
MRGVAVLLVSGLLMFAGVVQGQTAARALDRDVLIAALRDGGAALLLRHAQTVPGVGDPPNFTLSDCKTQRNLSEDGIAQVKRISDAAKTAGVVFARTLSSQWCRCRDTAKLFSGSYVEWPSLNSFFDDFSNREAQTKAVKQRLNALPKRETWLLVTHQVNITAITGISPAMGEGVVVRPGKNGIEVMGLLAL